MTTRQYIDPHCVLAQRPEYADEHQRCAGPQKIRRPGAPAIEAPLMVLSCACGCHASVVRSASRQEAAR